MCTQLWSGRTFLTFICTSSSPYVGTPSEVRWYAVDEWEGAEKGGPAEIATLTDRLTASMRATNTDA